MSGDVLYEDEVDPALKERGAEVGATVMAAVTIWQNQSPRTLQSTMRVLGMSELGGCREYIRASVAGDPKQNAERLKWAAAIGTWVGDGVERAVTERIPGAISQRRVTVTLPKSGIQVSGSTDAIILKEGDEPGELIDLKTRDGLVEVRRTGAKFKELVQVSGYLIAAIAEGLLPHGSTAHLVYIDRSGKDSTTYVVSVSEQDALGYLERADERLEDVANAIATGERSHRDEPESWCFHVECPFYKGCWEGYVPDGPEITHPKIIAAMDLYDEGRTMEKDAIQLKNAAKEILTGNTGVTDKWSLQWNLRQSRGEMVEYIDLRERTK